jgi:hypothetical protein
MAVKIFSEIENTENRRIVEVYKHPNNARASLDDPQTRYCYTVTATKFTYQDLEDLEILDLLENQGFNEDHYLHILATLSESNKDHIWVYTLDSQNEKKHEKELISWKTNC